ncbi:MAG: NAD(P)-dependent oxidoreductase [Oligoflexia bacterium]|nr:NAD(P)-dependent oxidoreductase [Oligoflexia bacterium]
MNEVILLGPTGLVGRNVLIQSLQSPWIKHITTLSRNPENIPLKEYMKGEKNNEMAETAKIRKIRIVKGCLENLPAELFSKNNDHVVIHFASKQIATNSQDLSSNIKNIENIFRFLDERTKLFVFGSSMSVYGQGEQISIKEDAPLKPQTILAKNRVECENLIHQLATQKKIPYVIFRPRFIIGKGDFYTIPKWIKMVKNKVYIGSGKQSFGVISAEDYAAIVLAIAKTYLCTNENRSFIYNIAYEKALSYSDIWTTISSSLNIKSNPIIKLPINKVIINLLNVLHFFSIESSTVTKMELMALSHSGSIEALKKNIGSEIIGQSAKQKLSEILSAL